MFCLRSWIPVLFFLYNRASPIYLLLFLTATYFLNRPCVYCSLLLVVLVIALFDFRSDWFASPVALAPPQPDTATTDPSAIRDAVVGGATMLATSLNSTAAAFADAAAAQISQRTSARSSWASLPWEWAKGIIAKGELRIDCLNTVIRL